MGEDCCLCNSATQRMWIWLGSQSHELSVNRPRHLHAPFLGPRTVASGPAALTNCRPQVNVAGHEPSSFPPRSSILTEIGYMRAHVLSFCKMLHCSSQPQSRCMGVFQHHRDMKPSACVKYPATEMHEDIASADLFSIFWRKIVQPHDLCVTANGSRPLAIKTASS